MESRPQASRRRSRAGGVTAGLLCLLLVTSCVSSSDARRTAATQDPEAAVAEALDRARTERGSTPAPTRPPPSSPAGTPDRVVMGRDDLGIEDRDEPVALSGRYELGRLPAGLTRSGERHLTSHGTAGALDVHVVSFDAAPGTETLVALDVRIVRGTPEDVARAQHEALEARSAVERTLVGGREALAYDTGVASRTLRWVDRRGTLVVLEGIGLSRAALADVAAGVTRGR